MKLQSKICGVKDIKTLNYIINHKYPQKFIGMIVNYKKSHRFIENKKAKKLTNIKKNNINYVAVLVAPTIKDLEKIKNLNFQYYQIYDQSPNQKKKIKKKYKKKIILALTIESIDDVLKYKKYEKVIKFQDQSPSGIKQSIWRWAGVALIGLMRNSGRK